MITTAKTQRRTRATREGHRRWLVFHVAADDECIERRREDAAGEGGGRFESSSSLFWRASRGVASVDPFPRCDRADFVEAGLEFEAVRADESMVL
jgi:hypothetical protein